MVHDYLSCEILLTSACNLRCTYCIAKGMRPTTMGEEVGQKAIDMFVFLSGGAKLLEFIFTGGEPLLNCQTFKNLVCYAEIATRDAGMDACFTIKTNGLLLEEEIINFLADHNIKAVVSIDGRAKTHNMHRRSTTGKNTHHLVLRKLRSLLNRGISCVTSLTVHPNNAGNILDNVQYLHKLGAKRIDIGPVYGTYTWNRKEISEFTDSLQAVARYIRQVTAQGGELEVGPLYPQSEHVGGILSDQWGCGAGLTKLAFLPDGQIAGCSSLAVLTHAYPNLLIGDVENGVEDHLLQRLLQQVQAGVANRERCKLCDTASNCTGGCLAINYAVEGEPFSPPSFYCQGIDSIIKAWEIAWGEQTSEHTTRS